MTHDNVTDIVERLNADADRWMAGDVGRDNEEAGLLSDEAASTIASLRKQLEDARSEALEEAAKVAESHSRMMHILDHTDSAKMIGSKIRALKGQPC